MTPTPTHTRVRRAAAAGAALIAAIYLLIGTGAVTVITDQPPGVVPPILIAAGLFAALAGLLLAVQRRWLWVAGAGLQVMVILGYLAISVDRTPAFEAWGITQKVLQVALLAALMYLALRRAPRPQHPSERPRALTAV